MSPAKLRQALNFKDTALHQNQNYTLQLTELLLVDIVDEHGGEVLLHLRYGRFSPQVGM